MARYEIEFDTGRPWGCNCWSEAATASRARRLLLDMINHVYTHAVPAPTVPKAKAIDWAEALELRPPGPGRYLTWRLPDGNGSFYVNARRTTNGH